MLREKLQSPSVRHAVGSVPAGGVRGHNSKWIKAIKVKRLFHHWARGSDVQNALDTLGGSTIQSLNINWKSVAHH